MHGAIALQAQNIVENELYYHIGQKDGLTDNVVTCFYQDYRGVMWMGTQYGLNSFDGSEIHNWTAPGKFSPDSLAYNDIKCITADAAHNLWIGTTFGLSEMNLSTQKIHTWQYGLGNDDIHSIACEDGKIWAATGDGILLFDPKIQKFKHFVNTTTSASNLTYYFNNDCNYVYVDSRKRLWVATVNGLWLFDRQRHTFEQYDSAANDDQYDAMVSTVFEDHLHRLWLGCWGKGIKQLLPDTRTIKTYNLPGMPWHATAICEQHKNGKYSLWLNGSTTEFDPDGLHVYKHMLKPIAQVAALDATSIYTSADNLVWIATGKGVFIIDPSRQLFQHHFIINQNALTGQNAGIYSEKDRFWLSGDGNFLLKSFDFNYRLIRDYTPAIKALGPAYNNNGFGVMNITPHGSNELWLSTTSGILKLDKTAEKISIVCNSLADSDKRPISFISNVFFNGDKTWCFPWRRGIWQLDSKANQFKPVITRLPEGTGTKHLNLQEAVKDKAGNIWITDLDYGVIKYSTATGKTTRLLTKDMAPYGRTVNILPVGNKLWTLSNTKVVEIDPLSNKTNGWYLPAGMGKVISCYASDENGNIWMATRTGLVLFNTSTHVFNQYTEEDGLLNNNLDGIIRMLANGDMLYAGENYVTSFKPAELLHVPTNKKLLLTRVASADSNYMPGKAGWITVPGGQEKLTFKWALVNYSNPLQNRYYNKLDGIDKDWNYAGNKGITEYNGLAPGSYKFRYRAVSADGLIVKENVLNFTIEPTFRQSWKFRVLLFVLLVGIVWLIVDYFRKRERRKAALQLQLSELEMKALRAQMNPHFLFNALNSIQECIVTKNTTAAHTYLSSFSKLVRMILENSEKQFITLADEIETLTLYLSLESLRFDDSFEYRIDVSPGIDTSFVHIPAMMIQPFVENTLWHGLIHKAGKKELFVSFAQQADNLVVMVQDNGVGRDHAAKLKTPNRLKRHSMGVKITEERLQLLEAEASIAVDDLKNEDGQASGTRVTIVIPLD